MDSQWQIIIAERGWVYVGRPSREGDQVVIRDCFNIRRWGTTAGLGEIARNGPTESTVLDDYGVVRVHVLGIPGGMVEANSEAWTAWLTKLRSQQGLAAVKKGKR